MTIIKGKGVSPGIAHGPIYRFERIQTNTDTTSGDIETEKARFMTARQEAARQLTGLAEKCSGDVSGIFMAHALIAEDEDLEMTAVQLMENGMSAAEAAEASGEQLAATLEAMDDEYMRARAADIRDVARRISDCAAGRAAETPEFTSPVIIAADDLAPSETLQFDRKMLLGFITRLGSPNSHTAILARALGIPAMCCADKSFENIRSGQEAYIDGASGIAYIEPDQMTKAGLNADIAVQTAMRSKLESYRDADDVSADGRHMEIGCNIGSPEDINAVIEVNARGVGLMRSEFLYLGRKSWPGEEEQYQAYRRVLEAMNGRRVIVRTLDIGADKRPEYCRIPHEENPALGMRGVRVLLANEDIFRTQLRALYRASAHGNLAIMFPMIASSWEILRCRSICADVRAQLKSEGIGFNENVPLGIMIETPAAAIMADELAAHSDFFSIGTNDLTQYLLACDRQNSALAEHCDPRHPALMRVVKMAADAAHRAGIWAGICGEAASDTSLLESFLDIGIDEISVAPSRVLEMRAALSKAGKKEEIRI
ncbi:MAG: phosphoenolpyruvate--protein phosphotransferase [Clostridia bacterium]|nr:phosphoenolpyruvate--protein phosphotransferase [Clostridia bacterium]